MGYTDFQNVHLTLVKTDFTIGKTVFWLKLVLGALYQDQNCKKPLNISKNGFYKQV
jgi:hypothetical protein